MLSDNANNVADAFDVLPEGIEAQIDFTDKAGAQTFKQAPKAEAGQARPDAP